MVTDAKQPELVFTEGRQMTLWADDPNSEDPDYLSRQLITYIGNKRALLGQIGSAVERVKRRLGKSRLRIFDPFSGSGVVSRFLKAHASHLVSNDIEDYAAVTARCYLRNRSTVDLAAISRVVADLNAEVISGVSDTIQPVGIDLYPRRPSARLRDKYRAAHNGCSRKTISNDHKQGDYK